MDYPYQCDGMLTLECLDQAQPILNKQQASELTALVAKDLGAVLKINDQSALVFCGAAFATEQLLQPQFPIQNSITQYASAAFQGEINTNQILSIGASKNQMPDGLQPTPASQNLIHMPFCLYTHDKDLAERFEASLMHKGMVPPPTYEKLNELTETTINHANYMSYLDLVAMMHNHFEQLGLSHLWEIIEVALVNESPKKAVVTDTHNHFYLVDHLLFTPYFSWTQFKQYFNQSTSSDYINWLMAQRLSLGAFAVHGLEIKAFNAENWPIQGDKVCLGSFEKQRITQTYWQHMIETPQAMTKEVTFFEDNQAGIVAICAPLDDNQCLIYYPITPQGISGIDREIAAKRGTNYTKIKVDFCTYSDWLL